MRGGTVIEGNKLTPSPLCPVWSVCQLVLSAGPVHPVSSNLSPAVGHCRAKPPLPAIVRASLNCILCSYANTHSLFTTRLPGSPFKKQMGLFTLLLPDHPNLTCILSPQGGPHSPDMDLAVSSATSSIALLESFQHRHELLGAPQAH